MSSCRSCAFNLVVKNTHPFGSTVATEIYYECMYEGPLKPNSRGDCPAYEEANYDDY